MTDTERRKSGPQNGTYEKILSKYKGECPPLPDCRNSNPLLYGRIKMVRALWRRKHEAPKYLKFSKWVRSIRKRMRKSQSEFARVLGVSTSTIIRWENGYGHMASDWPRKSKRGIPHPSSMDRLRNLDSMSKAFKKKKIPLEA